MKKDEINKWPLVIIVTLLFILLFLVYNFICLSFDLSYPYLLKKNAFFGNVEHNYNLSSYLKTVSLETQKDEIHKVLEKSAQQLKEVNLKLKTIEEQHNRYVKTEGKIRELINNILYIFGNDKKESYSTASEYNDKVNNLINKTLIDNEVSFNKSYGEVKRSLLSRKEFLEKKILYLTEYIKKLNNVREYPFDVISSRKHSADIPANKLFASSYIDKKPSIEENENYKKRSQVSEEIYKSHNGKKIEELLASLYEYTRENDKILNSLINMRRNGQRALQIFKKGEKLEKEGNYDKALENYRNLIIFNLTPYDREKVLKKIEDLNRRIVMERIIRYENKGASKLKVEADKYRRIGECKRATELYKKLIKEYPHSDYVDEAISSLIECDRK